MQVGIHTTHLLELSTVVTMAMTASLMQAIWSQLTNLRWIHSASTGVENLLFPGLKDSNVVVTNSSVSALRSHYKIFRGLLCK